jgi:carbonic anhydrase/acetyltransferase-like protein (isoleucine patch superfamily)
MKPEVHKTTFVDKTAIIIGNVKIGKNCGIYPGAVVRGDDNSIEIGDGSNVQDNCIIHVDSKHKVKIGNNVSIGHGAMVHGATIEDECLIGINSTVLDGAIIGKGSIVGANALVTTNMKIPENSLIIGVPGKIIKQDKNLKKLILFNAKEYQRLSKEYINNKYPRFNNKL